ncbi:DsbA family oxidoreductase [Paraglaciecola sp. MB-3u-78]|jgi:predicted DsbA family dithiol-disulfide isomerase|uniref:DsbA family oxidoreductase n=1 Tax=Paraglaciecola sp. MB-3u-78 TaxID=2058332 RepID=UPI000C3243F7|nr:DsbA family oxidoreductase [Paraglaciecola sp. MB-3u-78]PKG99837.1 disulfide bond formation protein DsbA [Paraglaciecola sp. MB-3u-78]
MNTNLKIDIVSDVSCPWCIIGYQALNQALANLAPDIQAEITWQPFELNPQMPKEGQEITEHITQKYGISEQQAEQNRAAIKERGLSVGYEFGNRGGGRIYNTFDAHRLLHWAHELGKQTELKLALFDLYFQQNGNPSDHQQLLFVVESIGLDVTEATQILDSDKYTADVRKQQQHYQSAGVSSVPAVIVNDKHLISGGQPSEVFEKALKQIVAETN